MKSKKEMKKAGWITAAAVLVLMGAVIGFTAFDHNAVAYAAENEKARVDEPITAKVKLTKDEAIAVALSNANPGAKLIGAELEDENGVLVYSVELSLNNAKIEIMVDANSGLIVDSDENSEYIDADEESGDETDENDTDSEEPITAEVKLTQDQAVSIAVASVDARATFMNAELEDENGVIVYGVHMSLNGKELDIKVDANTGQVLATDADNDDAFDEED